MIILYQQKKATKQNSIGKDGQVISPIKTV